MCNTMLSMQTKKTRPAAQEPAQQCLPAWLESPQKTTKRGSAQPAPRPARNQGSQPSGSEHKTRTPAQSWSALFKGKPQPSRSGPFQTDVPSPPERQPSPSNIFPSNQVSDGNALKADPKTEDHAAAAGPASYVTAPSEEVHGSVPASNQQDAVDPIFCPITQVRIDMASTVESLLSMARPTCLVTSITEMNMPFASTVI